MARNWEAPVLAGRIMTEFATHAALDGEIPAISKLWDDLTLFEQRDVLIALSAMGRHALAEAGSSAGMIECPVSLEMCQRSRQSLVAMLDGSGTTPWDLPQCPHCARLAAASLCGIICTCYRALGFTAAQIASGGWS